MASAFKLQSVQLCWAIGNCSHVAQIEPPVSRAANLPDLNTNTRHDAPHTAEVSDPVDLKSLPIATDLTAARAASAHDATATASPGLHDGRSTTGILEPQQVTTSLAAASTSPSDVRPTIRIHDHDLIGIDFPLTGSVAQSNPADSYDLHSGQQGSKNMTHGTLIEKSSTNEAASVQAPAVPSTERNPEEVHAPARSADAVAEQAPEFVVQSPSQAVQLPHQHDPQIEDGRSLAYTAPEVQSQSSSTASQAGEPISPHQTTKLSPQEITLGELRAQKAALLASLKTLPAIQVLIEENQIYNVDMSDDDGEPTEADLTAAANKIVKEHIKLLHEYNELKDVGQGLMGLIADQRGVRIVEVQDEFGIDAND